jgi:phage terminase large subunit GpA-like protein
LSAWADEHFRLSAESAAQPGRWRTLPYQRGILDAITDPKVTHISVLKSARVGYTLMVSAAIGYYIHHAPAPILVVMPTVDDAKNFSKETIAPMLRDVPVLSRIVFEDADERGGKDGGNTLQHKKFAGGILSLIGANSGAGFRRVSRKVVIFDEVDGYPLSAGSDGDPISLGVKRSEYFWDRKIIAGSTPLVAGVSRIERLFEQGDQRRYHVPCPHCGHFAPLVFRGDKGHRMEWPEGKPEEAFFSCQANGCVIEHKEKREIVERGEWRADNPHTDKEKEAGGLHVSFHLWAAYSYSPNAAWGAIAKEFLEAKDDPETLRTFVNTVLGETFQETGEAPDWERLMARREPYPIGAAPEGALFLTAGVDVQKDRFVYEVVGWGMGKESWSVDAGVLPADTSDIRSYERLDELLDRDFGGLSIRCLAVDSGFNTNAVYSWVRTKPASRVLAVKGAAGARSLVSSPTKVDVTLKGKRLARGCQVWPVGVDVAKSELYGWLGLQRPEEGQPYPPGWCHFPEYGEEFFKQLTAEHLVQEKDAKGFLRHVWTPQPGRENHFLDARVYARAAAAVAGLDRMRRTPTPAQEIAEFARAVADAQGAAKQTPPPPAPAPQRTFPHEPRRPGGFLSDARRPRSKGWLR